MDAWRGAVLLCSLMVGCGEPGGEISVRTHELPHAGSPSGEGGDTSPDAPTVQAGLGKAHLVADLFPPSVLPPRTSPGPESLVEFEGRLFFATHFEDGGHALWSSDGSQAGTLRVKDFPALSDASSAQVTELTPLGSQLFFVAGDETYGPELWVTDGTTGGTRLVKDITPGLGVDSAPYKLTALGNRLLFFRYVPGNDSGHTELWSSDGTDAGTVRVKDMGPDSSLSFSLASVGNTLYFVFTDAAHGTELWKTDGTSAGTVLVKDIQEGPASAYPSNLQRLGSSVFFLASTPTYGSELWRTDGTEAGTQRVRELSADSEGPIAHLLAGPGDQLFLTLSDPSDHLLRLSSLKVDGTGAVQEQPVATLPNAYADQPDADPVVSTSTVAGGQVFFSVNISSSGP
ncbi:MAG: ELWxxDGT repeat protein, partial [Cystobacter sp.]